MRYDVHKYPAVVIDGKAKQIGADFRKAESLIDRMLQAQPA